MAESEVKQLEERIQVLQAEVRHMEKQVTHWKNLYNEGQKHFEANSASRDQLDYLLDHLPVAMWAVNCEGLILQVLGAGSLPLGMGGGEVYGQSIFDVFGANTPVSHAVRRALAGEAFSQTLSWNQLVLDCQFLPQWNAEQDVVGVRCVALIVEGQVPPLTSEAIPQTNAPPEPPDSKPPSGEAFHPWEGALQEWVKCLPDFVLSVVRDGTIRFINRAIPPLTLDDVVGASVYDFIAPDRKEDIKRFLDRAFSTGETVDSEVESHDPDGVRRIYECRLGPFKPEGEVISVMVIARDVTELRQAQELARKRQNELEHLSRVATMGEMAAIVAHYLNNPLAAIANYAHGCIRRIRAGDVDLPQLLDAQSEIVEQCSRSSDYIRNLRGFLQKREINHAETDLTDILIDAIRLTEPEFRSRGLTIRTEILLARPRVYGDPLQIEQVLVNLLLNAGESMLPLSGQSPQDAPDDASRTFMEILVRVEPTSAGDIAVSVLDSGRGLSPGFEERIFEPFFTTKEKRLGMGLSVSRSIVESHGGRLEVFSNAGQGTIFRFNLPRFLGGHPHD